MKIGQVIGMVIGVIGGILVGVGITTPYSLPAWHWLLSALVIVGGFTMVVIGNGGDRNGQR